MSREQYEQLMTNNDLVMLTLFGLTVVATLIFARIKIKIPPMRINLMWIMLGAVIIRLPYLGESFWYDETFTSAMARVSFDQLGYAILADVHPPLAYLPFWAVAQIFGTSDMMLRLPSLVMSLISIWLAYHIAVWIPQYWIVFNAQTKRYHGLLGAGAVALLPTHLIYGTEARQYMMLTVLVMVAILAVARNRPSWFLFTSLLPFTHAHGYIYMGALVYFCIYYKCVKNDNIMSLGDGRWILSTTRGAWLITCGIVIIPSLIYIPVVITQSSDVADGFWLRAVGLGGVLASLPNVIIASRFASVFGLILVPATFFVVAKTILYYRMDFRAKSLIALAIAIPLITAIIAWTFDLNIFLTRAFIPLGVLWAILIVLYRPRWYFALVAIPLIYGILPDYQRMDIKGFLDDCAGSDVIYAVSTTTAIMAHHYYANVVASPDSDDLNQYYPLELFNIPTAPYDTLTGDVCVIYLDNPMSNESHKRFVASLNPYASFEHYDDHATFKVLRIANG